jgi:lipase (class 2)
VLPEAKITGTSHGVPEWKKESQVTAFQQNQANLNSFGDGLQREQEKQAQITGFPLDFEASLTGFGGDPLKTKEEHRKSIKKTPVILVHGNAGNSIHPKWGMQTMKEFLKDLAGYQDTEVWAMDYLGKDNDQPDLNDPHRNHIDEFRTFVDRVQDYLGVKRLDFIAHSLGCGMVNAYLRGLQSNGQWDNNDGRLGTASTFVSLAGATYGLGPFSVSEFKTGSGFETESHKFKGLVDDTPHGSNDTSKQEAPDESWKKISGLDNNEVHYVAIIAANDFVDAQNRDTGRREGADLNKRYDLGVGADGHEKVIKSQTVFNAFKSYLNQNPPALPVTIMVDKDSGSYGSGLQISIAVTPSTTSVAYIAERVVRRFNAGFIERAIAETHNGTLSNGQSLTLASDGQWEVVFRADSAEDVARIYGVNVTLPRVMILTDNKEPFSGSLDVSASTTRGTLYSSTNRENWSAGNVVSISRTATVSFIAIDSDGIASDVVSRPFEKKLAWQERETATLTEHFITQRLTVDQYVALGLELGFNAVITLYLIDGKWTLNPERARTLRSVSLRDAALSAAEVAGRALGIRADKPSGDYPNAFEVVISASGPAREAATVYYTEDGSDPSDRRNQRRYSFSGRKTFNIKGHGHHAVLCYIQNDAGNGVFESFAWSIYNHQG